MYFSFVRKIMGTDNTNKENPHEIIFSDIQHTSDYITELRESLGYYSGWIPQDKADGPSADGAWELIKNDVQVALCLDLLSLWSAGEYFEIMCEEREIKDIVHKGLSYIKDFTHARKSLIYDGTLYGMGLQKKYWKRVSWKKYPGLVWEVPYQIKEVSRERLRITRSLEDKTRTFWTIWMPEYDRFAVMQDAQIAPLYKGPKIQDFVWYYNIVDEIYPYFKGYGEIIYKLVYIKDKLIKYWADLAESWSKPYIIAKIDTMKAAFDSSGNLGTGFENMQTRVDDLLETLDNMVARHTLAIDKDAEEVSFHEHGTQGQNLIKEFIEFINKQFLLLILGSELATTTGEGQGAYAMAHIHKGSTQSKVRYPRKRSEERYTEDLVWDFLRRNQNNFSAIGLEIPDEGEVGIKFGSESEDIQMRIALGGGNDNEGQRNKAASGI